MSNRSRHETTRSPAPARVDGGPLAATPEDPGPSRRRIFAVCAIALFMSSVDNTIVATALKRIGVGLHSQVNWLGWTITIYSLGQMVMLPLAGKISDQFGRKKLFLVCTVVFTLSSVACGLSTSIYMLVPFRLIQSLGGGGFLPSASGIVSDRFGPERDRALGLFSSVFSLGGVMGPILGGVITQYWDWRGIFFVNLPIGVVLFVLLVRVIPDSRRTNPGKVDFGGVALMAAMIVSGMYAITSLGGSAQLTDPGFLAALAAALGFGWAFVHHARHAPEPFIPMRLLAGKGFALMNVENVLFGGAGLAWGVLIPVYAQNRYHITVSTAGIVLSAQAIALAVVAAITSYHLRRTGYRLPMAVGAVVVAASLVLLSAGARGLSPYWWLSLFAGVSGAGLGASIPAANNAILSLAPDQVAAISGIRVTFRQAGSILSISTVTAVLNRSADPGLAQAHSFWVFAGLLLVAALLTPAIPEARRGW